VTAVAVAEREWTAVKPVGFAVLFLFLLGWATEDFSLFNVGRYSLPLLYFAALPFCLRLSPRRAAFMLLPAISTLFAATVGWAEGVPMSHVFSQTALQVLAILLAAGVCAIDWRANTEKLARALCALGAPIVLYGGYQMVARTFHLPFAFLPVTNQQEYALDGLQRGWEKPEFTRASSLFVEPAAFGYFCLWLMIVGFSLEKSRLRTAALALALCGILFSQSLSAVIGVAILMLVYVCTHPINTRLFSQLVTVGVVSAIGFFLVPLLVPDALEMFTERIQQAASLDERADSGRVDHLPACWQIYKEAPVWGHGISSLAAAGADGSDVTSVTYALLLMERGAVGTILFLVPWLLTGFRAWRLPRDHSGRTLALLLSALNLYAFATSSVAYFLPFWFSLGIAASLVFPAEARALPGRFAWLKASPLTA
jgi:O-antigen ligase